MGVPLSAQDLTLLEIAGSAPAAVAAHVSGTRLVALIVDDAATSFVVELEGGTGWWYDEQLDDAALVGPVRVTDLEHAWSMTPMPPRLRDHYTGTLDRWLATGVPLTYLFADDRAFLHDGDTSLPMAGRVPPPLSYDGGGRPAV